jgi:hypothetical protein
MPKPIRFKSPTEDSLYVASTLGHAARIGPKWRELPQTLHADAIAAGAITDNMDADTVASQTAKVNPVTGSSETDIQKLIREGIAALLESDDAKAFDKAGIPDLRRLSTQVGFNVERQQMLDVWHAMEAESEAADHAPV